MKFMMLIPVHREPFPAEGSVFQPGFPESRPGDKDLHKYDLSREALGNTGMREGRSQKECESVQFRVMRLHVMWEFRMVRVGSYRSWSVYKPIPTLID